MTFSNDKKRIKVLNLYAGIGGNRKLWENVDVTAVENDPEIAKIYKDFFPDDKIVIADAHEYLLNHYKEFDFIWSSPPCQSHSVTNHFLNAQGIIRYPDMRLYEEILFLKQFAKCKWVVENVVGYYEPLIKPKKIGRHYFWSNFIINFLRQPKDEIGKMHGIRQKGHNKQLTERNKVNSELGLHIFNYAFKERQQKLV